MALSQVLRYRHENRDGNPIDHFWVETDTQQLILVSLNPHSSSVELADWKDIRDFDEPIPVQDEIKERINSVLSNYLAFINLPSIEYGKAFLR